MDDVRLDPKKKEAVEPCVVYCHHSSYKKVSKLSFITIRKDFLIRTLLNSFYILSSLYEMECVEIEFTN